MMTYQMRAVYPQNATDIVLVDCSRKLLVTFQICILNFGIYIGSSIYTPGELSVMEEFGANEIVATLGLSLFVLGYSLGPMLFSPMSETPQIGRSRIYFWTLFAFVLLELPTGYATNMAMLLVFRFLTGFLVVQFSQPEGRQSWTCTLQWRCLMGPLIRGFAAQAKGWRWTIWELTWLCAAVLTMIFFLMPETSQANILYRRAKRLRAVTGDSRLKSQSEIDAEGVTVKDNLIVLARAFTLTFSEPVVFFLDLYCALIYGILYLWFESFPLVFGDTYGFNIGLQGLVFLGIFVGGVLTLPCYLY
ncbi:MFS domain-containing protein [Fusarium falciforme]|uniref:MFS domain-containing protein n=1 Tax=Fusarium falciforme TaxID=195108 RepID=UPI002301AEFB|nr:MFS domain-containing protein [Fusarium falciforme]WAO89010.1 MFS domain-containing protein [Fusarium falciforme]